MDSPETLGLLRSIDSSLKKLVGNIVATDRAVNDRPASAPLVASDRDLDSQYGDPEVKARDPRDWTGPTMKGKRFSECPADYLDMVAERLDYFTSQNPGVTEEDQKKIKYQRLDASRARGWAKRIRAGWKPTTTASTPGWSAPSDDSDSVPW